jgi:Zn-dependent peptidase ImmA (M78 family)
MFFVNRDLPRDRLRWTLAHEIGHATMHSSATGDIEKEADRFASELLLPSDAIDHHLDAMTIQKAAIMKQQWKVSMAAIIRTAFERGRMNERRYRALFTSLGAQGYRTTEPFPIAPEEPRIAKELVELHRTTLGYNDFDLAQLLFSPDPQFFAQQPSMLRINDRPFFSFVKQKPPHLRLSM